MKNEDEKFCVFRWGGLFLKKLYEDNPQPLLNSNMYLVSSSGHVHALKLPFNTP